jgi:hypothetical protein
VLARDNDDRIVELPNGKFEFERTGQPAHGSVVQALIRRHWLHPPDRPLFASKEAGTLTVRGRNALEL